jgi:hypothetical protein
MKKCYIVTTLEGVAALRASGINPALVAHIGMGMYRVHFTTTEIV